jgi:hypothetical protein
MKIITRRCFTQDKKIVPVGTTIEVSDARAVELITARFAVPAKRTALETADKPHDREIALKVS